MLDFNNVTNIPDSGENGALYKKFDCYSALVWQVYLSDKQQLVVGISSGLTIVPIVALNFALSFALYKLGDWRKKSKFFIFVLSISDTVFGLVVVPAHIVISTALGSERSCWFERAFLFVAQTNGHFSFYTIMAIALERYLHVTSALRYGVENRGIAGYLTRLTSTTKGHYILLLFILILSLIHGLVPTYFFGGVQSNIPNIVVVFVRIAILAATYISYVRMYIEIRKHVRANRPLNQKHNKAFRTVVTILIIYTISFIPGIVTDFWTSYYSYVKETAAPTTLRFTYYLSFTLIYLNGAMNAGVLIKDNRRVLEYYRERFREHFHALICQSQVKEPQK